MGKKPLVEQLFASADIQASPAPQKVFADCLRGIRPSISFDPTNPTSIRNAKRAALRQPVNNRLCGDNCVVNVPCTLRMLEDDQYRGLMGIVGKDFFHE